jgi:hypothetical protein
MRLRSFRWTIPVLFSALSFGLLVTLLLDDPTGAQAPIPGKATVKIPPRSDAGYWHGTWYHLSRDFRMALWLRTVDGQVEAQLHYGSTTPNPESFTTDWEGTAEYVLERFPAIFEFKILEGDENTIIGTWDWILELPAASSREEHGRFTIYRIEDGRQLAVLYDDYEQIRRTGNSVRRYPGARIRVFNKASNRLVLWDELPF